MLAKMIEKIEKMSGAQTFSINNETYSDKPLNLIRKEYKLPNTIHVSGLDGICQLIKKEIGDFGGKNLFVEVVDYNIVKVFTAYIEDFNRAWLYEAHADAPGLKSGWRELDNALIELRSLCIPADGVNKLISTLSTVSFNEGMEISDNGMSQSVKVKTGVSLNQMAKVEPRIELQPFRTFLEVEQPASEFVVRVDKQKGLGLFEADGGIWKLEAKRNIARYFEKELMDLIEEGKVSVMM